MFRESGSSDIPSTVEFTEEAFDKYKGKWLLYRSLGHEVDGSFAPPLSFTEALEAPKEMIDVFQGLDHFLLQMKKHKAKKSQSGQVPKKTISKRFK